MKKQTYRYSRELADPGKSVNCDRRNPIIALRELKSIRRAQKEVREYIPPAGVRLEKMTYRSFDDAKIACYVLKKAGENSGKTPCMIYYHGGGFMMPLQGMMLKNAAYYVQQTGISVFLPDYRYVPKASCRMVIEDCFSVVRYVQEQEGMLRVDAGRMILYGDSAGGALAAGVAHLMKERGIMKAKGQMLIYPAADYRSDRYRSVKTYRYAVWPERSNRYMWKLYLRGADEKTRQLAAPLTMEDFSGLPLAYVEPQEMDILRDEGIAYAKKLERQGALLELNVIEGSYHGFDFDHESPLVRRVLKHRCEIITTMVGGADDGAFYVKKGVGEIEKV